LFFPPDVEALGAFYVSTFGTWVYKGLKYGFEDAIYANDPREAKDQLYRRMFAHSISFAGDPDADRAELFDIFKFYYKRRYAILLFSLRLLLTLFPPQRVYEKEHKHKRHLQQNAERYRLEATRELYVSLLLY